MEMAAQRSHLHDLADTGGHYALLRYYGRGHALRVAGAAAYVISCAKKNATSTGSSGGPPLQDGPWSPGPSTPRWLPATGDTWGP